MNLRNQGGRELRVIVGAEKVQIRKSEGLSFYKRRSRMRTYPDESKLLLFVKQERQLCKNDKRCIIIIFSLIYGIFGKITFGSYHIHLLVCDNL